MKQSKWLAHIVFLPDPETSETFQHEGKDKVKVSVAPCIRERAEAQCREKAEEIGWPHYRIDLERV